jgi:hypothetical protein
MGTKHSSVGGLNDQQAKFVRLVNRESDPLKRLDHEWLVECAVAAGYKGMNAKFCRKDMGPMDMTVKGLMNNPKILAALQGQKIEEQLQAKYGPDSIKKRLGSIMNANIDDYITWSKEGVKVKDSSKLTREQKSRILRVTERRDKFGHCLIDVEMANPIDAADKLTRVFGLYKDNVNLQKDPVDEVLETMSTEDLYDVARTILTKSPDLADVFARALTDSFGPAGSGTKEV